MQALLKCYKLLDVTVNTESTVTGSNQEASNSGVGELLRSCDMYSTTLV